MAELTREIYPSAPLSLVTIELRFGYEPRLNPREARDAFATAIQDRFPLLDEEEVPAHPGDPSKGTVAQIRATNADRTITTSLSARAMSFVIAGHGYEHFEQLLETLVPVVQSAFDVVPGARAERLGLRYLDELRFPVTKNDAREWGQWINPSLLGGMSALEYAPVYGALGKTGFATGADQKVDLQWGDAHGRTLVADSIPLELPQWPEGDFFIIDVDSYWEPSTPAGATPGLVEDTLLALHAPIGHLFEWAITDAARDEFRKEPT